MNFTYKLKDKKCVFSNFIHSCIIWLSHKRELFNGIPIFDQNGNRLGESTMAAKSAITQVVVSRILMATPGMSK